MNVAEEAKKEQSKLLTNIQKLTKDLQESEQQKKELETKMNDMKKVLKQQMEKYWREKDSKISKSTQTEIEE